MLPGTRLSPARRQHERHKEHESTNRCPPKNSPAKICCARPFAQSPNLGTLKVFVIHRNLHQTFDFSSRLDLNSNLIAKTDDSAVDSSVHIGAVF